MTLYEEIENKVGKLLDTYAITFEMHKSKLDKEGAQNKRRAVIGAVAELLEEKTKEHA